MRYVKAKKLTTIIEMSRDYKRPAEKIGTDGKEKS